MNQENPFAPSNVTVPQLYNTVDRRDLVHLSTRELKRLKDHASSTFTLAVLWIIAATFILWAVADMISVLVAVRQPLSPMGIFFPIWGVVGVLSIVAAIGTFRRAAWGRALGLIVCTVMLLGFPCITVLGVSGLIAFAQGGPLFGPDRLSVKRIKDEYQFRRAHRIG